MSNAVPPLLVLQARAEARALLYAACEDELQSAVGALMQYAREAGIVDQIGAERAYAIIQQAFAGVADV